MKGKEFVQKNMPFALKIQEITGIPAIAIIAQAALESDWGRKSIGNNIFGVKYRNGDWGFQKVLTTEYFDDRPDFKHIPKEDIVSIEYHLDKRKFKVMARLKFADYPTPYEAFLEYSKLLLTKRYVHALQYRDDAKEYLKAIAASGYATDPNYASKMADMVDSVLRRL